MGQISHIHLFAEQTIYPNPNYENSLKLPLALWATLSFNKNSKCPICSFSVQLILNV